MPYPAGDGQHVSGYRSEGDFVSTVTQNPTGLDVPTQISFGPGGDSLNGIITVAPNGTVTVNETAKASIKVRLRFARSGAAGVSHLFNWAEISLDGGATWNVAGNSIDVTLRDSNEIDIFFDMSQLTLPKGAMLRSMFARDSQGDDSGGLVNSVVSSTLAAAGVPDAPSAQLTIYVAE